MLRNVSIHGKGDRIVVITLTGFFLANTSSIVASSRLYLIEIPYMSVYIIISGWHTEYTESEFKLPHHVAKRAQTARSKIVARSYMFTGCGQTTEMDGVLWHVVADCIFAGQSRMIVPAVIQPCRSDVPAIRIIMSRHRQCGRISRQIMVGPIIGRPPCRRNRRLQLPQCYRD